jgi:hypothetical protein
VHQHRDTSSHWNDCGKGIAGLRAAKPASLPGGKSRLAAACEQEKRLSKPNANYKSGQEKEPKRQMQIIRKPWERHVVVGNCSAVCFRGEGLDAIGPNLGAMGHLKGCWPKNSVGEKPLRGDTVRTSGARGSGSIRGGVARSRGQGASPGLRPGLTGPPLRQAVAVRRHRGTNAANPPLSRRRSNC